MLKTVYNYILPATTITTSITAKTTRTTATTTCIQA